MNFRVVQAEPPPLLGNDLYRAGGNGTRAIELHRNSIPWAYNTTYRFSLDFQPGQFTVVIKNDTTGAVLESRTFQNNTYQGGGFGFYALSQGSVTFSSFDRVLGGRLHFAYTPQVTDADGDALTYSLLQGPTGMTIDPATGALAWLATEADIGDHPVAIRVTDARGAAAEQSFVLHVTEISPTIVSTPTLQTLASRPYTYDVAAVDPAPDAPLTFSLTAAPSGMQIDPLSGLITWTPSGAQQGSHPVTVRVVDGAGNAGTQSFTVSVVSCIVAAPCTTGQPGLCGTGEMTCPSGALGAPTCNAPSPVNEVCGDSDDNDCDGTADEAEDCVECQAARSCLTGIPGRCMPGVTTCPAGIYDPAICVPGQGPIQEICSNLIDDDCDGQIDDPAICGNTCRIGLSCFTGQNGACNFGKTACPSGPTGAPICLPVTGPTPEICLNEVDDDCDALVDEPDACATAEAGQPAALRVELAQPVTSAGTTVAFVVEIMDAFGHPVPVSPNVAISLESLPGETRGTPATLVGQAVRSSADTRGIFTVHAVLAGTQISGSAPLTVLEPGSVNPFQAEYGRVGHAVVTLARGLEQLFESLDGCNAARIEAIMAELRAEAASFDPFSLRFTSLFEPEDSSPPTAAMLVAEGFTPGPTDQRFRDLVHELTNSLTDLTTVLTQANPAALSQTDLTQIVLIGDEIRRAVVALGQTPVSVHGVVMAGPDLNSLFAVTYPQWIQAEIAFLDALIEAAKPLCPSALPLAGLEGRSLALGMSTIAPQIAKTISAIALHPNLGTVHPAPQSLDLVTGASAILQIFDQPNSHLESLFFSPNLERNLVFVIGGNSIPLDSKLSQLIKKVLDPPRRPEEFLKFLYDTFNENRNKPLDLSDIPLVQAPDARLNNCVLNSDPFCRRLVFARGLKPVSLCGQFLYCAPRPVVIVAYNVDTGAWAVTVFPFIPSRSPLEVSREFHTPVPTEITLTIEVGAPGFSTSGAP